MATTLSRRLTSIGGAPNAHTQLRAQLLTTATADTALGKHVRVLLAALEDIRADRTMAARMNQHTTGRWLRELANEERWIWRRLRGELGARTADQ